MTITIEATPGAADANSFGTEAQFIAYLATRLNIPAGSTVSGSTASEDEKKAMIEATRDLNDLAYVGERVSPTQALAWPRVWAPNPDAPTLLMDPEVFIPIGSQFIVYYGEAEIPQRLIDAWCELALQYRKAGTTDLAAQDDALNLKSLAAGPVELVFADAAQRARGLTRFPRIVDRLTPLLASGAGDLTVVRV